MRGCFFSILGGIIVIGGVIVLIILQLKRKTLPTRKVELFTLEAALKWFQEEAKISEQLKKNPNLQCVLLKKVPDEFGKKLKDNLKGKNLIVAGLFNSSKNSLENGIVFEYQTLDESIEKLFGDKEMVILK